MTGRRYGCELQSEAYAKQGDEASARPQSGKGTFNAEVSKSHQTCLVALVNSLSNKKSAPINPLHSAKKLHFLASAPCSLKGLQKTHGLCEHLFFGTLLDGCEVMHELYAGSLKQGNFPTTKLSGLTQPDASLVRAACGQGSWSTTEGTMSGCVWNFDPHHVKLTKSDDGQSRVTSINGCSLVQGPQSQTQ